MASMVLIPDLKATFDLKDSGKKLDAARDLGEQCDGDAKYVLFGHTVGEVLKPEERDLYGQFEEYFGKELSFKARCRKAESPIDKTEETLSGFYKKTIGFLNKHDGIEDVDYGEVKKRMEDIYDSIREYLGKEKTEIVPDSFIALPYESERNFEFDGRMVSCVPGVPENSELPKKEYLEKKTDYKIDKNKIRNANIIIANNLPFAKLLVPEPEHEGKIFIGSGKKHAVIPGRGSLTIYEKGRSAYTIDLSNPPSLGIVNFSEGKKTATAIDLETLEYLQKSEPIETAEAYARFGIKDFLLSAAAGGLAAAIVFGGGTCNHHHRRQNEELRQELRQEQGEKEMLEAKIWVMEQKIKVDDLTRRIEKVEDELDL